MLVEAERIRNSRTNGRTAFVADDELRDFAHLQNTAVPENMQELKTAISQLKEEGGKETLLYAFEERYNKAKRYSILSIAEKSVDVFDKKEKYDLADIKQLFFGTKASFIEQKDELTGKTYNVLVVPEENNSKETAKRIPLEGSTANSGYSIDSVAVKDNLKNTRLKLAEKESRKYLYGIQNLTKDLKAQNINYRTRKNADFSSTTTIRNDDGESVLLIENNFNEETATVKLARSDGSVEEKTGVVAVRTLIRSYQRAPQDFKILPDYFT